MLRARASALWQRLLLQHQGIAAAQQAYCSGTVASTQLLLNPEQLTDSSQLKQADLQSLAFILGTRDELYQSFATDAPQAQLYFNTVLKSLDPARKSMLVHKLVAVSGQQATPVLLAWACKQLGSALAAKLTEQATQGGQVQQHAWYPRLAVVAQSWVAANPSLSGLDINHATEQQCIHKLLTAPGALTWEVLLSLPYIEGVVTDACTADSLLSSTLAQLGLRDAFPLANSGRSQAVRAQPTADSTVESSSTARLADGTAFAVAAATLEFEAKQKLASALRMQGNGTRIPCMWLSHAFDTATSDKASDPQIAQSLLLLHLVRFVCQSVGATLPGEAITVLRMLRCSPASASAMGADSLLDAKLLEAAAQKLLQQHSLPGLLQLPADKLQTTLAQAGDECAVLAQRLQAERCRLLVAGNPWLMATSRLADVAVLTPSQFWTVHAHAHKQQAAGRHLYKQLGFGRGKEHAQELLDTIWLLPVEDRAALSWVLLRQHSNDAAAVQAAAGQLISALLKRSVVVQQDVKTAQQAVHELAHLVKLERQMAELDLLSQSGTPALTAPSQASDSDGSRPLLPSQLQLDAVRSQLPSSQLLLFDLLHQDLSGSSAQASQEQLTAAFHALLHTQSSVQDSQLLEPTTPTLPESLREWLATAKKQLVGLSPAFLQLLGSFLQLRVADNKSDVDAAVQQLKVLLDEVRTAILANAAAKAGPRGDMAQKPLSPYWATPDAPPAISIGGDVLSAAVEGEIPNPAVVAALLGRQEAAQFEAWLQATSLARADLQPYQLLDETHREMDMQRAMLMEYDPQLHMVWEVAPRPWTEAGPHLPPDEFLDTMRPLLDKYLAARGMRPMMDAEWQVYAKAALVEFNEHRSQHERALQSQGHSTFFNSRAEAVYLRQLLDKGIPAGAPLHAHARKYLTVLEANSSWTFAQRKRAVKRLIELSVHFAQQPPPSERGSPFAPLFAPNPPPVVPQLTPWTELRRNHMQLDTK